MVARISGIRDKTSVKSTRFNFGGRRIAVSFLKGEALGFHIYGPRYKELRFDKTYQGLPLLRNLVGILGGGGYLIVVDSKGERTEYIIGLNGDLLKKWREKEIGQKEFGHTVLAKVGDTFFHEIFPEIEPVIRKARACAGCVPLMIVGGE